MIALAAAHLLPKFTPAGLEPITAWRQLQVIMGKVSRLYIGSTGLLRCFVYVISSGIGQMLQNFHNQPSLDTRLV